MSKTDSILIRAMNGREVERHPVWFMRQAGRYLPEYKKIKAGRNIFDIQMDPESSSEITVLPVKKLGVDAAILYSDIMIPIRASGYPVRIDENVGPIAEKPLDISDKGVMDLLFSFDTERDAPYVSENIRLTAEKLPDEIPIIGFSGGPFTLFSYLIEGMPSRTFEKSRFLMVNSPEKFARAMNVAADIAINYLKAQIKSGVSIIQLFDSWAGYLNREEYSRFVLGPTKRIFSSLPANVPKIYFSARTSELLDLFSGLGCDFLSIDSNTDIKNSYLKLGGKIGLQGNLSPEVAQIGGSNLENAVNSILDASNGISKFVFNLAHGVLKNTNPKNLSYIVEKVKSRKIR